MQQQLYLNLFNEFSSDPKGKALLSEEAKSYPYFSLLHYYLLKNTTSGEPNYSAVAGKTALHFNNSCLLNIRLNQKENQQRLSATKVAIDGSILNNINTKEKLLTPNASKQDNAEELLFEPLFVTDYFASQGIKLSEEVQPGDKLGQQLKSFTEWLKTMKKVNGNRLQESTTIDKTVEKMAEKSNIETEVLTETMAEVYVKQGKLDKASEIYQKLSLHNPAKSTYFADKIELLKEK